MGNKNGPEKRSSQSIDIRRRCSLIISQSDKPTLPAPQTEIIISEFAEKLQDLNIPEDQKQWLLSQTVEIKWQLLCRHLEEQKKQDNKSSKNSLSILEELNNNPTALVLKKVHSWLESASKREIEKFIENNGNESLINIMIVAQELSRRSGDFLRQEETLKCLVIITEH